MPYKGLLELEVDNARLQKNFNAVTAENQWLQEDNNIQRATADALSQKVQDLERALAASRKAHKKDKERLEFLIALGGEMLKEREQYKNCNSWLLGQYQQYQQLLHSQGSNTNSAATEEQDVAAGSSCTAAPATSPEGDREQAHTVAPSPPRKYHLISLRVHAGVKMPSFVKPPALLRLAFPSFSGVFCSPESAMREMKEPPVEKKEVQESPSIFQSCVNRLCSWFW